MLKGIDLPRERFCFACFDGNYPVPVPYDAASHKFMLEDEPLVQAVTVADGRAARAAYADAGVDVEAGDRAVALLRERGAIAGGDLLGRLGGFGAALAMPPGYREPVLVSATDGVGTKTEIARQLGRFDTIGRDLVAMCADDVVCHGAEPLFFLDYVAVGKVVPERVAELVGGVAAGCAEAGCALVGGETAEHPGVMEPDAFDLAGFCVGIVERDRLLDGSRGARRRRGHRHRLVRAARQRLLAGAGGSIAAARPGVPYRAGVDADGWRRSSSLGERAATGLATLGDVLLTPTRIYALDVLALRDDLDAARPAPRRHRAHHRRRAARQPAARGARRTWRSRSTRCAWPAAVDLPAPPGARPAWTARRCAPRSTAGSAWRWWSRRRPSIGDRLARRARARGLADRRRVVPAGRPGRATGTSTGGA